MIAAESAGVAAGAEGDVGTALDVDEEAEDRAAEPRLHAEETLPSEGGGVRGRTRSNWAKNRKDVKVSQWRARVWR